MWSFCYRYCGPLWPSPHAYKASQKTRMMIVIGHPQDTVQCMELGTVCHVYHYIFVSLLLHSDSHFNISINLCYCTVQPAVHNTSCDNKQIKYTTATLPDISLENGLYTSSFVPQCIKPMLVTNSSIQVRSFTQCVQTPNSSL